jgi:hypothetical protein
MTDDKIEQIVDRIFDECVESDDDHFWVHRFDSSESMVNIGRPKAIALIRKLIEECQDEAYLEGARDHY